MFCKFKDPISGKIMAGLIFSVVNEMGLKNSAANYQTAMNAVVAGLRHHFRTFFSPSHTLRKIFA